MSAVLVRVGYRTSKAGVAARQGVDDVSSDVYPQFVQSVLVVVATPYQPLITRVRLLPFSTDTRMNEWINDCAAQPPSLQFPTVIPLGHAPTHWTPWSSVSSGRLIFITRLLFHQSYWHLLTSCAFYCSYNVRVRTIFHVVTAFCQLLNKRICYVMLCCKHVC